MQTADQILLNLIQALAAARRPALGLATARASYGFMTVGPKGAKQLVPDEYTRACGGGSWSGAGRGSAGARFTSTPGTSGCGRATAASGPTVRSVARSRRRRAWRRRRQDSQRPRLYRDHGPADEGG